MQNIRRAFHRAYQDAMRHHMLQVAAALSYWFVLSIFPALLALSAIVSFLPFPNLFPRLLVMLSHLVPYETMQVVYTVVEDVLSSRAGTWFSFGMLGIIWTASSACDSLIEALDIAYDVEETRPYWKTRLLAIGLSGICGGLLLGALAVMILGPRFGNWLASRLSLSGVFVALWPLQRWTIAIAFTVLAVEMIYYIAPNVKQRFVATLPGAIVCVAAWYALSALLGVYFRHFAEFNRTYGTLGGLIALMTWVYWIAFVLLLGAELNSELAKEWRAEAEKHKLAEAREAQEHDAAD